MVSIRSHPSCLAWPYFLVDVHIDPKVARYGCCSLLLLLLLLLPLLLLLRRNRRCCRCTPLPPRRRRCRCHGNDVAAAPRDADAAADVAATAAVRPRREVVMMGLVARPRARNDAHTRRRSANALRTHRRDRAATDAPKLLDSTTRWRCLCRAARDCARKPHSSAQIDAKTMKRLEHPW